MVSDLFFYQLGLIALVWLCLMLQWAWPSDSAAVCPTTPELASPVPKRHREPTPFAGLTTKPPCDACAHSTDPRPQPPNRARGSFAPVSTFADLTCYPALRAAIMRGRSRMILRCTIDHSLVLKDFR
jgi:hypothetical protein